MTWPPPPGLSRAHFTREFLRASGESPHAYLLTRRLERAAALLRTTDRSVADICLSVGLQSIGSFTTSFTRTFGVSPTAYRASFPPAPATRSCRRASCASTAGRNAARFEKTAPRPRLASSSTVHPNQEDTMIRIATAQLWVHDQDEALEFYTEKVGMEVRSDVTMPEMGDFRWLTVGPAGQDDVAIVLMAIPGPPVMDEETASRCATWSRRATRARSSSPRTTAAPRTRSSGSRGLEFTEAPEERPYGIDSSFRDPSGNSVRLTQVRDLATL